jgi:hypothetical protein
MLGGWVGGGGLLPFFLGDPGPEDSPPHFIVDQNH